LVVIALVVRTLRPKHASGAGTAAPPDVMVALGRAEGCSDLRRMDRYVGRVRKRRLRANHDIGRRCGSRA